MEYGTHLSLPAIRKPVLVPNYRPLFIALYFLEEKSHYHIVESVNKSLVKSNRRLKKNDFKVTFMGS